MSGINKLSSLGYALGLALGVTFSGVAVATGPITDTFTTGGTLTATQMNNIKNAVNDLQGNVPSTSCRTNAGAVDTGATRVGPLCVDNVRQAANQSWATAVAFCRAAGKRLMTPGEWAAAQLQGALTDAANDQLEWVDAVAYNTGAGNKMFAGYMGTTATLTGEIAFFDNQLYTGTFANIYFRCAR